MEDKLVQNIIVIPSTYTDTCQAIASAATLSLAKSLKAESAKKWIRDNPIYLIKEVENDSVLNDILLEENLEYETADSNEARARAFPIMKESEVSDKLSALSLVNPDRKLHVENENEASGNLTSSSSLDSKAIPLVKLNPRVEMTLEEAAKQSARAVGEWFLTANPMVQQKWISYPITIVNIVNDHRRKTIKIYDTNLTESPNQVTASIQNPKE